MVKNLKITKESLRAKHVARHTDGVMEDELRKPKLSQELPGKER